MMNKWKFGMAPGGGAVNTSPTGTRDNTGGGCQKYGDTHGMEYNQKKGAPESDAVIKTEE